MRFRRSFKFGLYLSHVSRWLKSSLRDSTAYKSAISVFKCVINNRYNGGFAGEEMCVSAISQNAFSSMYDDAIWVSHKGKLYDSCQSTKLLTFSALL